MRVFFFFFKEEEGIRDLVRSRGLGDVYKRQAVRRWGIAPAEIEDCAIGCGFPEAETGHNIARQIACLLYTPDAADARSRVDLGGRRIHKKKNKKEKK